MPNLAFIDARFPDPALAKDQIATRLKAHLRILIAARHALNAKHTPDALRWLDEKERITLPLHERQVIERRAELISRHHIAATGLAHLKAEDAKKLEVLRNGVRLARVATEHQADELASALHVEFPWMGPATETVWQAMRRSVHSGDRGFRLPPILLDGPPGIGKSAWARTLGDLLTVPTTVYEATNENASFGLVGSQRSWGTANPGRLINTILTHRVGNPVIVVDEVEKSGSAMSSNGQTYRLTDALLPLLEPASARRWSCPYFEVKFDMSYVIWVLTSNDYRRLPEPLLSRCPPIRLSALSRDDLVSFAQREGARRGLLETSIEVITDALGQFEHPGQITLRSVQRMLERGASLEAQACMLH